MNKPSNRLVNLFGALALGVSDRMRQAASAGQEEAALGGETAAALVVMGHSPGLSIQRLGQVLQLSQPGAVRLVDRLTAAGLAQRTYPPHDRRAVALKLTKQGETKRESLLKHRHIALDSLMSVIEPEDYAVFERVVETMLETLPNDATTALNVCRWCDDQRCRDCPMDTFGPVKTA